MYELAIRATDVAHQALDLPGVTLQVLHMDSAGGMTVLTHLAPGATIPEHWQT